MITTLPAEMNCVEISEPGGPEVLKPSIRPLPKLGRNDILIKVEAAGVNRPDVFQRAGHYPAPKGASDLPGLEVAGRVASIGEGVDGFAIGAPVAALVPGGGYAEYVSCPQHTCLPDPYDGLAWEKSAAIPETAFTVWYNVFTVAHLTAGERFLVHGGSSGIGTMAIKMAKALGAEVITTCGTEEKCELARSLGADLAINYTQSDFAEVIEQNFGRGAINVVLDMVGGDYVARNFRVLAQDGRLSFIAFLRGAKPEIDLLPIMSKRLTVTGSTMRRLPEDRKVKVAGQLVNTIWPLIKTGAISPVIHEVMPLTDASTAHRKMEAGEVLGKIVLTTRIQSEGSH